MRVLYVNHTSLVGGAERSLLDLLGGLPDAIEPVLASPDGALASAARRLGVRVHAIPGTAGSLKLHPLHTPRAVAELAATALAIRRLVLRLGPAVVHANSIRAGITAAATPDEGAPLVVHVRDRLPAGAMSSLSLGLIGARADLIASNSAYTAASLPPRAAPKGRVVRNPVDLARFDPDTVDRATARAALGIPRDVTVLAVVAQITPWKGQEEAVRALGRLRQGACDMRLLLVGETKFTDAATRYDNHAYRRRLERLVAELGLQGKVIFAGEREDVPMVLRGSDVLLVPSWEEPFGRAVVEGMAMGLPVIATSVGGPAEIITDGVDGLLLPPRDPDRWAVATEGLLADEAGRARLGAAARLRARDFAVSRHVEEVLSLYEQVARRPVGAG